MNRNLVTVCLTALVCVVVVLAFVSVGTASPPEMQQSAGAPTMVSYQGQVKVGGVPYTGTGYFKFAIWSGSGGNEWTNDGTAPGGGEPTASVALAVNSGLFNVLLGDTSLTHMTGLDASVFDEPERYLRIWFSSDNGTFTLLTPDQRIAAVPYALQAEKVKGYANVVVVAKSGGDFTSVQAAIDSITDAASGNPYLVWVAPGVYEEQVTMKPYVHLQGAGQQATVITSTASYSGEWPPTEATLVLASDTSLRDLTVGNSGTGDTQISLLATEGVTRTLAADVTVQALGGGLNNYAIFLSDSGTSLTLQQVTAQAEDGSNANFGLVNTSGAGTVLQGGAFTARSGEHARGIINYGTTTTLEAESVTALGENGSSTNVGLYNHDGATVMLHSGSFTGRGGEGAWGIDTADSGTTLVAESVTALGENGTGYNCGLDNYNTGTASLRGGTFTARGGSSAYGIDSNGDTTLEAESVTALAENSSAENHGLSNENGAAATLRGGIFTGRGGTNAYGIYNADSNTTLEAESVSALAENGSNSNYGLYNNGEETTLRGGTFTGRGGTYAWGIKNYCTLEAESVTALGENGSLDNYGLHNLNSATVAANSSQFIGSSNGLYQYNGTVHLGVSQLDGGATRLFGSLTCFQVYDGSYAAYSCP